MEEVYLSSFAPAEGVLAHRSRTEEYRESVAHTEESDIKQRHVLSGNSCGLAGVNAVVRRALQEKRLSSLGILA